MKITKSGRRRVVPIVFIMLISNACLTEKKLGTGHKSIADNTTMEWVQVSKDGKNFVYHTSGSNFTVWGLNYDRDDSGRLIEDYWKKEWQTVVEDFEEMKQLGANVIRVHLQVGRFMDTPEKANDEALQQLSHLVKLAEEKRLYLDITGLGNYHKQDIPDWFSKLDESDRWAVQASFWKAVAGVCAGSPAIFCYDLMNEPIWPSTERQSDWLLGELGGKFYAQRITLNLGDRNASEVAKKWIDNLVAAIHSQDKRHMITLGVIPWAHVFPGAKLTFYAKEVSENLDFVSVHFYPKGGKDVSEEIKALETYDVGKPLVIEETFPLSCTLEELNNFIDSSRHIAEGWIGFYWGKKIDEYPDDGRLGTLMRSWIEYFQTKAKSVRKGKFN